jgi:hypothetical protein
MPVTFFQKTTLCVLTYHYIVIDLSSKPFVCSSWPIIVTLDPVKCFRTHYRDSAVAVWDISFKVSGGADVLVVESGTTSGRHAVT